MNIDTSVGTLGPLFVMIWGTKEVPTERKKRYLIKLPKKDLSLCSNYKGITLLSIPGKVFNRVMLNRVKDAADPHLRDHKIGFRKNRSCADQIVTTHHLEAAIGMELVILRHFYRA